MSKNIILLKDLVNGLIEAIQQERSKVEPLNQQQTDAKYNAYAKTYFSMIRHNLNPTSPRTRQANIHHLGAGNCHELAMSLQSNIIDRFTQKFPVSVALCATRQDEDHVFCLVAANTEYGQVILEVDAWDPRVQCLIKLSEPTKEFPRSVVSAHEDYRHITEVSDFLSLNPTQTSGVVETIYRPSSQLTNLGFRPLTDVFFKLQTPGLTYLGKVWPDKPVKLNPKATYNQLMARLGPFLQVQHDETKEEKKELLVAETKISHNQESDKMDVSDDGDNQETKQHHLRFF